MIDQFFGCAPPQWRFQVSRTSWRTLGATKCCHKDLDSFVFKSEHKHIGSANEYTLRPQDLHYLQSTWTCLNIYLDLQKHKPSGIVKFWAARPCPPLLNMSEFPAKFVECQVDPCCALCLWSQSVSNEIVLLRTKMSTYNCLLTNLTETAPDIYRTHVVSSQYIDIYKTGVPTQYANESSDITEIDTQESQNNKNDTTWKHRTFGRRLDGCHVKFRVWDHAPVKSNARKSANIKAETTQNDPPVRKSTQTSKRSGEKSRKRDKGGRGRVTKRLRTETARYHIIKVIGVDMTTAKHKLRITTI